jgi:leader peptidase (prepilin peptidase)/N-methyltransferase
MKSRLPFGPFLAAGAIAYIFFGPELIYWYLGILR